MNKKLLQGVLIAALLMLITLPQTGYSQLPLLNAKVRGGNAPYKDLTSWTTYFTGTYCYASSTLAYTPPSDFVFYYDGQRMRYFTMSGATGLRMSPTTTYYGTYFYPYYTLQYNYIPYYYYNRYYGGYIYPFFAYNYYNFTTYPYPFLYTMKILLTGTYPNRVLIFEWKDFSFYYINDAAGRQSVQVKLYEGTNVVEVHYGDMDRGSANIGTPYPYGNYYYKNALIGFSGYYTTSMPYTNYINIDPLGNGNMGWNDWEFGKPSTPLSRGYTYYVTVRDNATYDAIQKGDYIRLTYGVEVVNSYPASNVNLRKGYIYGDGTLDPGGYGDDQRPGIQLDNAIPNASVRRTIAGPLSYPVHPNYRTIYDATNSIPNMVLTRFSTKTPAAPAGDNIAFGNSPSGALDLKTNESSISGGYYRVYDEITHSGKLYDNESFFNIAAPWDLQIMTVVNPRVKENYMYSLTGTVPLRLKVVNKGINNVSNYYAIAKIYNQSNEVIFSDSLYWEAETPADQMKLGDERFVDFRSWAPLNYGAGNFKFTAYVNLNGDVEKWNNYWPWQILSTVHEFRVAPEFEGEAVKIMEPVNINESGTEEAYYVGRPVSPRVRYQNNGLSDISDAPTNVTIRHLNTDTEVYNKQNIKVSSIAAGLSFNTTDMVYDPFTPLAPGDYEIQASIEVMDDDYNLNDKTKDTFTVQSALNGTYTIGPDKSTGDAESDAAYNDRNFTSIREAVDELFKRGISGPVVFEFTAASYSVGDVGLSTPGPALDLRSKIEGVSSVNTVTFRPASSLMTSEGNVVINLYSTDGVGIIFGQSLDVSNPNAIINNSPSSLRKQFANSEGYLIFDGGAQKTLKFVLYTDSKWNAAFFLSQGASNITIKNCVIISNNPSVSWTNYTIPVNQYTQPTYLYEKDYQPSDKSYSAAISMRSVPPMDDLQLWAMAGTPITTNTFRLDTLVNRNNIISNNKISGFAYGIISLGIGPLTNSGAGKQARYYNNGNTLSGNMIYNVSRAGILMGNEENSVIKNNRIFRVATSTTGYNAGTDVAGIILGGERTQLSKFGYNNINITVDGNEISDIGQAANSAWAYVYGIKAEQVMNDISGTMFPNAADNFTIKNNVIWGLRSNAATVSKIGIRLSTERKFGEPDFMTKLVTPEIPDFFASGAKIANNTIVLGDDGYSTTQGIYAGVVLQNSNSSIIKNNAIAMLDNNDPGATNIFAAVCYQGLGMKDPKTLVSNRNIYYLIAGTDQPAIYRYVNINSNSQVLYEGTRNEFSTLNQWYTFSGMDELSANYNFTADLAMPNIADFNSKMRVKNTPTWPQGSKLNNRGENLVYVDKDIDGNQRGLMSQNYDIGAFEFPGILLNSDAEITAVSAPGAYMSTSGPFGGVEHIMTKSPVDVRIKLTNNGSLPQTGMKVTCKIMREDPANPGNFYTNTEIDVSKYVTVESGQTVDVSFDLADNIIKDFNPSSYSEWNKYYEGTPNDPDSIYVIPAMYASMQNNVSPLYKIVIGLQNDENIGNNVMEKTVRFYLKRSKFDIMLSAENTYQDHTDLGATEDVKAGHRNYDSLVAGLARLGWVNGWDISSEYPVLNVYYDVFERSAWEPRAVDYTMYRTLIWTDADENALSRQERDDLTKFVGSGTSESKKNLVIGSQEMVRLNYTADSTWVKNTLYARKNTIYPTDPNGGLAYTTQDDANNYIIGETVGRGWTHSVLRTGLTPADQDPVPGLMSVYTDGIGLSRVAYSYNAASVTSPSPKETAAGVATVTIPVNTVYLGIDWRHYGTIELVLRAVLDFLNKNGGNVIPVELTSFEARTVGNRVELLWETAGEINTSHFEVERSQQTAAGNTAFEKIGEEKAAGRSSTSLMYGPVTDAGVSLGNTYIYRLKMVDLDGKFEYSSEVKVTIGGDGSSWLGEAVPNPAAYESILNFTIGEGGNVELSVFDLSGRKVLHSYNGAMSAGSYTRTIDVSGLAGGYYTIVLNVNGKAFVRQLHIVR